MAGPIFARLAGEPTDYDLADFRTFGTTRVVHQELARGRRVSAWISPELMIGAEASGVDWGGWPQFMPATAHWRTPTARPCSGWSTPTRCMRTASDRQLAHRCSRSVRTFGSGCYTTEAPVANGATVTAAGMRWFHREIASVSLTEYQYRHVRDPACTVERRKLPGSRLSFASYRGPLVTTENSRVRRV